MPDEPQQVRSIDYKSAFPFTLIFKGFRIAIHPSKLVLALLALLLIVLGGWLLDEIWRPSWRAVPDEISIYQQAHGAANPGQEFYDRRAAIRRAIVDDYHNQLNAIGKPGGKLKDLKWYIVDQRQKAVNDAAVTYDPAKYTTAEAKEQAQRDYERAVAAAYAQASGRWAGLRAVNGIGLFETLYNHQVGYTHRLWNAARGELSGGRSVCGEVVDFLTIGPAWAIRHHPVFFAIFGIWFLVVWAIFGGAIARIAAVQVARDEKISFRQALSFSTGKFLSFVSAPIIPLLIIVVVGIVVALGGLVFNIPLVGPVVAGALFFLALAAGFVMTLVLLGLVGGFNLMYPTVAVEGSDSFDAISRSFSYLYARPWRLLFYTVVALIYGGLCYVFVRFFIKLMLTLTHAFAGLLVFRDADNLAPLWLALWPDPSASPTLNYGVDYLTLAGGQDPGAFLIWLWNTLTIAALGAFAISFYFSANTIIYVLMRKEVDATELDDVYLEQTEDEFGEPAAAPEPAPAATAEPTDQPPTPEPPASPTAG